MTTNESELLHLLVNNIKAQGCKQSDGTFVVYKGSMTRESLECRPPTYLKRREKEFSRLRREGIIQKEGEFYVFTQDYTFGKITPATVFICGYAKPDKWRPDHIPEVSSENIKKKEPPMPLNSGNCEEELITELKKFLGEWNKKDRIPEGGMKFDDIVILKGILHNVNNIATLKTTQLLVERLAGLSDIIKNKKDEILRAINGKSANSNGFDILWKNGIKFVAEVKCNIPSGGKDAFGSRQRELILKDLEKLRFGNTKSKETGMDAEKLADYYKFLGVYVHDKKSAAAVRKIHDSPSCKQFGETELIDLDTKILKLDEHKQTIYIVMLRND